MSSRLKILMISMISILVVLTGVAAYGYYSGMFTSSADELARAKQIDADSKAAKYTSCSSGVCVGIDDKLDAVEPGQKITIKAYISVPAGKNFKVARYSGGYGFFSTYVSVGNKAYSPAQADEIIFPDGRTDFDMYITVPANPSLPDIYESITIHGRLVDSNAFGYGYGYGYNSENFVYLYASHQTPIIAPKVQLVSSSPANDATNVSLNSEVIASFDKALNPSLTKMSIFKGDSAPEPSTLSYENDNKTITLAPNAQLTANTKYTVNIRANGNDNLFAWSFTTTKTQPPVIKITAPGNGITTSANNILVKGTVIDADTDTSKLIVKVKGKQVPLATNGAFSEKVSLSYGANLVNIMANDPDNNIATKEITINRKKPWWCWFSWMCK